MPGISLGWAYFFALNPINRIRELVYLSDELLPNILIG